MMMLLMSVFWMAEWRVTLADGAVLRVREMDHVGEASMRLLTEELGWVQCPASYVRRFDRLNQSTDPLGRAASAPEANGCQPGSPFTGARPADRNYGQTLETLCGNPSAPTSRRIGRRRGCP